MSVGIKVIFFFKILRDLGLADGLNGTWLTLEKEQSSIDASDPQTLKKGSKNKVYEL